jgi:acetate kinase
MTEESPVKQTNPTILTINGGSSSITFALFEAGGLLRQILEGAIERIGLSEPTMRVRGLNREDNFARLVTASDHIVAVGELMDWIEELDESGAIIAVGHRVVHGGPTYSTPQRIDAEMIEQLKALGQSDPEHRPEEILLIEAFQRRYPQLPQVACFDAALMDEGLMIARSVRRALGLDTSFEEGHPR